MPTSSVHDTETLIADYEVYAGGSKIPPEMHVVLASIEVDLDIDVAGMFSLLLHASEREQEKLIVIDADQFRPGNEIKIRVGYGSRLETLIVGEITNLSPEFGDNGAVLHRVCGYDRLYRLGFGRKVRSFRNMKDSDIAAQVAQDWQLTPQVDATGDTLDYVLQNNQTDREFLAERASRNGYVLRVDDRKLYFEKSKESASAVTTMTYGETLIEFFPLLSTATQTGKTEVRGWSVKDKEAVVGEAAEGDVVAMMDGQKSGSKFSIDIGGSSMRLLAAESVSTKGAAEDLARVALNRAVTEFVTGEGRCVGNPDIKAGTVVELKGLGHRFSGRYYVPSCTHSVGTHGYYTSFTVRRTAI